MARGRFEGITLLIDGDTVGLDKSLGKVNSRVRDTESELRKVERLLKYNPRNTELVAQKQQLLADKVENTRTKLNQLKDAEQQVQDKFASGDIKEKQYRAFQRELVETESKLKHFERELLLSQSKLNEYGEAMQKAGDKMTSVGKGMTNAGKNLTMTVTAPIVGIGAAATNSAIKFESAFAGVRKTVDATEDEFLALEKGIRDMALEIPASAEEIASVAEAAGQLGIEKDNILDFTRTIIDLGESTNMTTEQAANELARFANITGMSQQDFDRFGSSLVSLGNNFATTESEIMSMSMRLAGAGSQIGLSETDIAALATTMSSLGVEAEAGGTAMSMVMKKMQNAVSEGGADLEHFAAAAHMSASEFANAFNADPMGALINLVQGLEQSAGSGENLNGILDTLGVKGIRESDALLRMAGNSELLASAVDLSSTAFEENTALTDEAAERYKTTESQLAMLKNTLNEIGIMIGEILIPVMMDVLEAIKPVLEYLRNMDEGTLKLILTIAGIAAAIGPLLIVLGLMAQGLGAVFTVVGTVMTGVAKLGVAFKVAGGAVALLTNPIGIAIGVITLLGAAFMLAYNKSETFRNFINGLGSMVTNAIGAVVNSVKNGFSWAMDFLTSSMETIKNTFNNSLEWIRNIFTSVFNGIKIIVSNAVQMITDIFMGYVGNMKDGANQMMSGIGGIFGGFYELLKNLLLGPVLLISQAIVGDWQGVLSSTKQLWGNILDSIGGILKGIVDAVVGFGSAVWGSVNETWGNVVNGTKAAWDLVWAAIDSAISKIGSTISNGFNGFVNGISNVGTDIWNTITGLWDRIMEFFRNISLKSIGTDIMSGLLNGVKSGISSLLGTLGDIARAIPKPLMKILKINSPSRVFREIGEFTGEGLEDGLISMGSRVRKASQKMADNVKVKAPDIDTPGYSKQGNNSRTGSGSSDGYDSGSITINFNGDMSIRNDQDITKLAREIEAYITKKNRGRG